jgi:hypothetical protein
MNRLAKRIEGIERRIEGLTARDRVPLDKMFALLETPPEALTPGEPELESHPLRLYCAAIEGWLSFARERPELFTEADVEEWQARREHAESLLEASEDQDEVRLHLSGRSAYGPTPGVFTTPANSGDRLLR